MITVQLALVPLRDRIRPGGRGAASAAGRRKRNRVVIQVSDADPAKWNLALNNARNMQTDLGAANVDIEIVAYGPGHRHAQARFARSPHASTRR